MNTNSRYLSLISYSNSPLNDYQNNSQTTILPTHILPSFPTYLSDSIIIQQWCCLYPINMIEYSFMHLFSVHYKIIEINKQLNLVMVTFILIIFSMVN